METMKLAEPDYDFVVEQTNGEEFVGKYVFTSEVLIVKCEQGRALMSINSQDYELKANANFMLLDCMLVRMIECSDDFLMTTCRFSLQFFNEIYPVLDNKVVNTILHCRPDFYNETNFESVDLTFQLLCNLHKNAEYEYRNRMAVNLTINYIYEIYNLTYQLVSEKIKTTPKDSKSYIFDTFCELCNDHHTEHRDIKFYADKLNISSRYLHTVSKETVRSTPKEIIDFYVSGTAKRWLLSSDLTTQQITYKLNFPDQATFGQFFKRNVGMSPSEFRNKYK